MQQMSMAEVRVPPEINLDSVRPLIYYLNGLPDGWSERDLSREEDMTACAIVESLSYPSQCPRLQQKLYEFLHPSCRPYRTLCVWYCIARAIAYLIEQGD